MKNLNRFGRLGWHGGKLVLRVLAILVPVVVGVLWSVFRILLGAFDKTPERDSDAYPYDLDYQITHAVDAYGHPWQENQDWITIQEMTDAVWGKAKW